MTNRRVAVVGGGLAGIAAALDCAEAGEQVSLLEVRPRLGGAACSFERDGMLIDNGQHVFLRCCSAYRALLDRLGTESETFLQDRLAVPVVAPGGRTGWLRRNGLPAPFHLAASLARYRHLSAAERFGALRAARALSRLDPADPTLDARSFGDWLHEQGQSANAIEALWDLIARPTLNLPAADASLALAVFVFRTGLLEDREAGDIGFARVPLSLVHAEPAAKALRALGADVHLRHRVERVTQRGDGSFAVEGTSTVEADAVVMAVPHDRVAPLLPPEADVAPGRLERLGVSPIVNLHVVYERPVTSLRFAAAIRSPVQWVFDRSEAAGVDGGQYLAMSLSAADEEMALSPEELSRRSLPALEELFPAARGTPVLKCFATREHAATFRAAPGVRDLRPGPPTALPGLVLAGAWTDTGWPATMEGAVRSGHAAAREVLAAFDRRRAPAAEVVA